MIYEDARSTMSSKPQIELVLDNKRPSLKSAPTEAVFTDSATLWSDPIVTWSDPNAFWGGMDQKQSLGPSMYIDQKRPSLQEIGYITSNDSVQRTLYRGMPMGLLLAITYSTDQVINV